MSKLFIYALTFGVLICCELTLGLRMLHRKFIAAYFLPGVALTPLTLWYTWPQRGCSTSAGWSSKFESSPKAFLNSLAHSFFDRKRNEWRRDIYELWFDPSYQRGTYSGLLAGALQSPCSFLLHNSWCLRKVSAPLCLEWLSANWNPHPNNRSRSAFPLPWITLFEKPSWEGTPYHLNLCLTWYCHGISLPPPASMRGTRNF